MKKFIKPDEVIDMAPGLTIGALAQLRFTGKGPKFYKPTPKTVLYDEAEVLAWIESSARTQTGQAVA